MDIESTFLPIGRMRQIDRVTSVSESAISGEIDVGPQHWVFPCHFPGDPVFPGTLIIEAAGQLAALWAWEQGQRGRPRLVRTEAQFHQPVCPTIDRIELRAAVRAKRNVTYARVEVWAKDVKVAVVGAVLVVLPCAAPDEPA